MARIRIGKKVVKSELEDDGMLMGEINDVYHAVTESPVYCNAASGLCSKQWGDLIATNDPAVRFCISCANSVQLVKTYKQLTALRHSGLCVAYAGKRPLGEKPVP